MKPSSLPRVLVTVSVGFACVGGAAQEPKAEEVPPPIQALLVTGGCSHEYEKRQQIITEGIRERVEREIEWKVRHQGQGESDVEIELFQSGEWAKGYDIVVHDYCFPRVRNVDYVERILAPHREGLPAVLIHGTMHSFRTGNDQWFEFCGVTSRRHGSQHPYEVKFVQPGHPILQGGAPWITPKGELYFVEKVWPGVEVLTESTSRDTEKPQANTWGHLYGPKDARIFGTTIGNDVETMIEPAWLDMVSRGFLWSLDLLGEDQFREVAREESLSSITLEDAASSLPNPGRNVLLSGKASALSTRDDRHAPGLASDGDVGTIWRAGRPGPCSWEVRIEHRAAVQFIAVLWDGIAPVDYHIEAGEGSENWVKIAESHDDSVRQVDILEVPVTRLDRLRVNVPRTATGKVAGIREIAAYQAVDEIPAGLKAHTGSRFHDRPLFALKAQDFDDVSLSGEMEWIGGALFPIGHDPVQLIPTASGRCFLVTESAAGATVWEASRKTEGQVFLARFHETPDPETRVAWDGEWVYLLEGRNLTSYRDTNDDGRADERFDLRQIFVSGREASATGTSFNLIGMGMDGWIYSRVFSRDREKGFSTEGDVVELPRQGLVRFRRDGSGLQVILASNGSFEACLCGPSGEAYLSRKTAEGSVEVFRLYDFPGRGWSSQAPIFSYGAKSLSLLGNHGERELWVGIGERVFALKETENGSGDWTLDESMPLASIPGVTAMAEDGTGAQWMLSRAGDAGTGTEKARICLVAPGALSAPVDLDSVPSRELIGLLRSANPVVRREASFEVSRRKRAPLTQLFAELEDEEAPVRLRGAALSALSGSRSDGYFGSLLRLAESENPEMRALAFRFVGNYEEAENHPVFGAIAEETVPQVSSAILSGILRSKTVIPGLDRLALKLAAHQDPALSSTAAAYLIEREASAVCFEVIDSEAEVDLWPSAFSVLARLRLQTVVEGLVLRLEQTSSPEFRRLALDALIDLYYFDRDVRETWGGTPLIDAVLRVSLADHRVDRLVLLDRLMTENIPIEDLSLLVELGKHHVEFESAVINLLIGKAVPRKAEDWLTEIINSEARDPDLRVRALAAVCGIPHAHELRDLFRSTAAAEDLDPSPETRVKLLDAWFSIAEHHENIDWYLDETNDSKPDRARLAWMTLLHLAEQVDVERAVASRIELESAKVQASGGKAAETLAEARLELARRQGRIEPGRGNLIADLSDDELVERLAETVGSVGTGRGRDLFRNLGCAECHNVHGEGPSLGPILSARIGTMTDRDLIHAIRHPGGEVTGGFETALVELSDGTHWRGMVEWEDDGIVVLRDVAGNRVELARGQMEARRTLPESIMPMGLIDDLIVEDFASLMAYLRSLAET